MSSAQSIELPPTATIYAHGGHGLDVAAIRRDFPILTRKVRGKPLVYLDNAASNQRPQSVIDAVSELYSTHYANVHRGVHTLSQESTEAYEATREKVRGLLNAETTREIIFTSGATESINLVAQSYLRPRLRPGDEILLTEMEHHANIVSWQLAAEQTGAVIRAAPITDAGVLRMDLFTEMLNERTRMVAVTHMSNALGTINPVKAIVAKAHEAGAAVLIDGAQSAPHLRVDVQALDCDFYAFSGHKMCGPTGIGVLYGKERWLEEMPPWQGGGDMIDMVSFEKTTFNDIPFKFEAGTPNIAGGVGLGVAIDYLMGLGMDRIAACENELLAYATNELERVAGLRIIGTAPCKAAVISFVMDCAHPHDVGTILDQEGIAVRTGHHCAQPLMRRMGVASTARASLAFYNTRQEIDALVAGLAKVRELFA